MSLQAGMPEYSSEVQRRFERAPRLGRLASQLPGRVSGAAGDVRQGVRVAFEARVAEGRIVECRFRAYGCPHVIAAASWVAEHAEGRPAGEAGWPDPRALAQLLEVPPHKLGSLLVVEDAFRACMAAPREA